MKHIIAVTSLSEQRDTIVKVTEALKVLYHTDTSIIVAQSSLSRIDVYHTVNSIRHIAASYHIVIVPITISLENLRGYPSAAQINITRVIKKLDDMKKDVLKFVEVCKKPSPADHKAKMSFENAMGILFAKEKKDAQG